MLRNWLKTFNRDRQDGEDKTKELSQKIDPFHWPQITSDKV